MIKAWSYSRLTIFEQCKLRAKLQYIDRIPEPPRPLPPGKLEHANDRGSRVHEAAELFVKGGVELVPELKHFEPELNELKVLYSAGKVLLEGEWGMNAQWMPVGFNSADVWIRLKLDALVLMDKHTGVVIDYKTGKKQGNEVKHAEQGQLYALVTFLRYPELESIDVEFWYTDANDVTKSTYSRAQALKFLPGFNKRGLAITGELEFPPNPNQFSCRWCPYGPRGTGHCTVGV